MKTLILDFDGTLADTRQSIIETVYLTLNHFNLPQPSAERIQSVIGLSLRDTFTRAANLSDEETIAKCIEFYRSNYDAVSLKSVTLFPNVADTLKALYLRGYIITVASCKGKASLERLLDTLGIAPYISHIYGEQDVANKKPAPDMALHILEKTSTNPLDAIVVGDTVFDIQMGKSAGCRTCAVTYGNHSEEKLITSHPDYLISDFMNLLSIVDNEARN